MSKQVIVEPPGTNQLPPVRYSVTEAAIEDYRAKFTGLDPTTPDGYEETRVAIGVLRTKRGEVEAMRKRSRLPPWNTVVLWTAKPRKSPKPCLKSRNH